jgi:hypothetical protein
MELPGILYYDLIGIFAVMCLICKPIYVEPEVKTSSNAYCSDIGATAEPNSPFVT